MRTPALLAILDGVGLREELEGNAFKLAHAPYLHALFSDESAQFCRLHASGRDVGLPEGQMGNSEVGHLNIGAGRIVNQELTRIDIAIEDGTFFQNQVLIQAIDMAVETKATLHFLGLVSDGGVHSMMTHLEALLALAAHRNCKRVRIHAFLDGRDVAPTSAAAYLRELNKYIEGLVTEHMGLDLRISSISGRYYAMDRDKRWERVEKAWRAMTVPFEPDVKIALANEDAAELVEASYAKGITDEFVEPIAIGDDGVNEGDSMVFFNFRPDRARELTRAFIDPEFEQYGFERRRAPRVNFVCMTEYDPEFDDFGALVAFEKEFPANTLADYFAKAGIRQLHIAETEKYAHVTFFFNGGKEEPKLGEERILIASPKVATYDLQPEMSAPEVARTLADAIQNDTAEVYIVNFANGDMVGHTGSLEATIQALETVDACLKEVVEAIEAKQGVALITADHGNSECMFDEQGSPWTAHTTSPVPLALIDASTAKTQKLEKRHNARLADIAPTLLDLMELPIPREFTGTSLLLR